MAKLLTAVVNGLRVTIQGYRPGMVLVVVKRFPKRAKRTSGDGWACYPLTYEGPLTDEVRSELAQRALTEWAAAQVEKKLNQPAPEEINFESLAAEIWDCHQGWKRKRG